MKTPFPQSSHNNETEEELQGSISLSTNDNHSSLRLSSQNYDNNNNSYAINYGSGDYNEPSGKSDGGSGSFISSLVRLLTSGQQQGNAQPAAEYDEENEPPLLEGKESL